MSGPETLFVPWIRPAILGDADSLDDARERQCESSRCGAVFRRQEWEDDAAWAHRRYCCAACWNGKPPIPTKPKQAEDKG